MYQDRAGGASTHPKRPGGPFGPRRLMRRNRAPQPRGKGSSTRGTSTTALHPGFRKVHLLHTKMKPAIATKKSTKGFFSSQRPHGQKKVWWPVQKEAETWRPPPTRAPLSTARIFPREPRWSRVIASPPAAKNPCHLTKEAHRRYHFIRYLGMEHQGKTSNQGQLGICSPSPLGIVGAFSRTGWLNLFPQDTQDLGEM